MVQLHGNAHNVSSHYRYVTWLVAEGVNVLCFDYRGYGLSEGKPERAGILKDSRAAIRYAASRPDVDPDRIVLLGQSLGGANAVVAAATTTAAAMRVCFISSLLVAGGSDRVAETMQSRHEESERVER